MPVMGPNLDAARQEGNQVGQKLLAGLVEEHHLFEVTAEQYEGYSFLPKARERWIKAKEDFVKAVEELFVQDGCNSF